MYFRFLALIISFFIFHFSFFILSTPAKAAPVNLLNYLFPTTSSGINISSGEYFKVIDEGNGFFKIQKSTDPRYYERFRVENGIIYHVEEATWANENGNITCNGTGRDASATYENGGVPWLNTNMNVGESFTSSGVVVAIDKESRDQCDNSYEGPFTRSMKVKYKGCVTLPTGVTSDDAVVLEIDGGPGTGEQFIYDSKQGWIGFNRGSEGTGAYATDQLSTRAHATGECLEIKLSARPKSCPSGWTCPDINAYATRGEVIKVKRGARANVNPEDGSLSTSSDPASGKTGPEKGKLYFPKLIQENSFFSSPEISQRALPDSLLGKFEIIPKSLSGILSHPGCGQIVKGGSGPAEVKANTAVDPTPEYDNLILRNTFHQSFLVTGFGSTLKFTTAEPQDPEALKAGAPTNFSDCLDRSGESLNQKVELPNLEPEKTTLLGAIDNALKSIISWVGSLLNRSGPEVEFNIQQTKYLEGEKDFAKRGVGDSGFLNSFIPDSLLASAKDQEEPVPYQVVGQGETHGVNYDSIATYKKGTCDLISSMYPSSSGDCFSPVTAPSVTSAVPGVSIGTLPRIPFRDASIRLSETQKQRLIDYVLSIWPDAQIRERWDDVVNQSIAAGINPAFTLAIWIEESGASSYDVAAQSGFGCFPGGDLTRTLSFNESLNCFINFTADEHGQDFYDWAKWFCGPNQEVTCANNRNFVANFPVWYARVTGGGSDAPGVR